jgi:hypothetical protein
MSNGQTNPPEQLISDLRTLLRDKADFNRLLETQENRELSDSELALALRLALSDYNSTPPASSASFTSIPEFLVLWGGLIMAFHILGLGHTRNEFNYTSGGVSVRVWDKTPHYMNWIGQVTAKYDASKLNFKIAQNVNASLGTSVPSEYASVSFVLI